jgi:hypothetical protein
MQKLAAELYKKYKSTFDKESEELLKDPCYVVLSNTDKMTVLRFINSWFKAEFY